MPAANLDAVLAGEDPDPALLRRLAPALDQHTADLFLFAGRVLPDDLTPSLLTGPWNVGSLLYWHRVYDMPAPHSRSIPIGDLTALLGLAPMEESAWSMPYERPAGLAELAWEARRLSDEQLRQAMHRADELTGQAKG